MTQNLLEEKDLSFFLSWLTSEIKGERKCDPKSRKLTIIYPFKESKYKIFWEQKNSNQN